MFRQRKYADPKAAVREVKAQWDKLHEEFEHQGLTAAQITDALQKKTWEFRYRLMQRMNTEDEILPEAYAVVCAAIENLYPAGLTDEKTGKRKPGGIRLNDRQIEGAVALHRGCIIEMKTGEGKTFTATLPLYLNALSGKGCILVTTNAYLAGRDADEMLPLFEGLGLKEVSGVPADGGHFTAEQKREIYAADIVYSTQSVLACDYLFDNLRGVSVASYLREMNYCIVDEADAVLLDSANIPHIVSGRPRVSSRLTGTADYLVSMMKESSEGAEDGDYEVDGESVWLTEKGIRKTEEFFGIEDLYAGGTEDIVKAVTLALRAHAVMERDKRYVVKDNRVVLLDVREGRPMERNMLQSGQHQALEAKEKVPLTSQRQTMASITFQSYFNMYPRLAGMTGTGVSDADEFRGIYGLGVTEIKTAVPVARTDEPIRIYPNHKAQMDAAMEDILRTHRTGQPVLIIVSSIRLSEEVDALLLDQHIPHSVLNAKNLAKEAEIIREAAQKGTVTVATSVAGRGTDIKLGQVLGQKPERDDVDNLLQHVRELSDMAEDLRNKRNMLQKNPEALSEKISDLKMKTATVDDDVDKLEEGDVQALGGLAVIGIGMMRNRRSEQQARGRSGRKGDKGRSVFYVSLEDDVVAESRPDWMDKYMTGSEPLTSRFIRRTVMNTQRTAETKERLQRRQMRKLDDSVTQQRNLIYQLRAGVLEKEDASDVSPEAQKEYCRKLADQVIGQYLADCKGVPSARELERFAMENLSVDAKVLTAGNAVRSRKQAAAYLREQAESAICVQFGNLRADIGKIVRQKMGGGKVKPDQRDRYEKEILRCQTDYLHAMKLRAIDEAWFEQADYLGQLKTIVAGRRTAGRNLQREFDREAHRAYDRMAVEIERNTLRNILFGRVSLNSSGEMIYK